LLWECVERKIIIFYSLTDADGVRMKNLMVKYRDHPMDLGDASMVVTAEALKIRRIFTLDRHFRT
jgi:predicted nucleic acid-binding protein